MNGYNSCIFAYGQTGSGKTHTMLGTGFEPYHSADDPITQACPRRIEPSVRCISTGIYGRIRLSLGTDCPKAPVLIPGSQLHGAASTGPLLCCMV